MFSFSFFPFLSIVLFESHKAWFGGQHVADVPLLLAFALAKDRVDERAYELSRYDVWPLLLPMQARNVDGGIVYYKILILLQAIGNLYE